MPITSINGEPLETEAGLTALKFGEVDFWSNDGYIYTNGSYQKSNDTTLSRHSSKIPVRPGDTVGVSFAFAEGVSDRSVWLQYVLYDASGEFISTTSLINSTSVTSYDGDFAIPDGAAYVSIQWLSYGDTNPRIKVSSAAIIPYSEPHSLDDTLPFELESGYIYTNGSIIAGSQGAGEKKERYTSAIEIPPDRQLDVALVYGARKLMWWCYALYDEDDNFLGRVWLSNNERIYYRLKVQVTNDDAAYIRFTFTSWDDTAGSTLTVRRSFYGRALASGGGGGGSASAIRTVTPSDLAPGYQGTESVYGGMSTSSNPRCCTRDLVEVCKGDTVAFADNETLTYWFANVWGKDGTSYASGWKQANGKPYVVPADGLLRVTVSPTDRYDKSFVWTDAVVASAAASMRISASPQAVERTLHDISASEPQAPVMLLGNPARPVLGETDGYTACMREALDSLMMAYRGDTRKVPFILTTDQHAGIKRNHRAIFDELARMVNWDEVSFIANLGDTISNNWSGTDDATSDPYVHNATLENYRYATESLPKGKRLEVFGNHDTWGPNWDGKSTGLYTLTSMKYLNPYFNDNGGHVMRYPDNSGNKVLYDPYFGIKYVVIACWDYADPSANHDFRTSAEHWGWIIDQLAADDGYDIVIVSHIALDLTGDDTHDIFTDELKVMPSGVYSEADGMFNARKSKGSGSFTDDNGVTHTYDFTGCTTDLLCAIAGHSHSGVYTHIGGGLMNMTFTSWASYDGTNSDMWFGLIDRDDRKLSAWRVSISSASDPAKASVDSIEIPLDKATE